MAKKNRQKGNSARKVRALQAKQRRQKMTFAVVVSALVVAGIVALVVVKLATGSSKAKATPSTPAPASVTKALAAVPLAALAEQAKQFKSDNPLNEINAPALTEGGKPKFLYIGAEYCPYCAAERWAVAIALSKFGSFSGLGVTHSSPSDAYPNTATLSFHGSSYSSQWLTFVGKETETNQRGGSGYTKLDPLTRDEESILTKYDQPQFTKGSPQGIPFLDLGGRWVRSGSGYDPGLLKSKTAEEIAAGLSDMTLPATKAILGNAGQLIHALCSLTKGQPGDVCSGFQSQ